MRYRRFGRTELQMPVLSCGGMRYQYKWQDVELSEIPSDNQENLEACIHRALELGINHIETARGYGSSEAQLGCLLPSLPREKLIVQTKVAPSENPEEFRANFERSMSLLRLDYIDLFSFHGINTTGLLDWTLRKGGCMEIARQFQREGRIKHIGFSTHAPLSVILDANNSGEFDYVNLHWYFVNETTWPAVLAAEKQDMGVFIISPTDKGGMLYQPPVRLTELTKPLSPIQFNDLFCLSRSQVHTLSIGPAKPSDFDEHVAALDSYDQVKEVIPPIEARLRAELAGRLGTAWMEHWSDGLPEVYSIPGEVNLQEILRLWTYAKGLDLVEWGRMRYNLLGHANHWFPGNNASDIPAELLSSLLADSPFAARIPSILQETHEMLAGEAQKRLSES